MNYHKGFDWPEMCGWCSDNKHERCCWEGCACTCKPRRWLRAKRWVSTQRELFGLWLRSFAIVRARLAPLKVRGHVMIAKSWKVPRCGLVKQGQGWRCNRPLNHRHECDVVARREDKVIACCAADLIVITDKE